MNRNEDSRADEESFLDIGPDVALAIQRTIQAGWECARKSSDVISGGKEIVITRRLRNGMIKALKPGGLPWRRSMIVLPGTESCSHSQVVSPDGRTDLSFVLIDIFKEVGDHDPHAIVECKRIAGMDSNLCREYVVNGIDRFGSGKYAARHARGFMAGYLLAGDARDAASGINKCLGRQGRKSEFLGVSKLIEEPWVRDSEHPRSEPLPPILLYHAFLQI